MLKKIALWVIAFALSHFVASLGWAEQGQAFMYIYLGAIIAFIIVMILVVLVMGIASNEKAATGAISGIVIIATIFYVGVILIATWVATQIFNVDYFVVYQIMTFGQCIDFSSKDNETR